MVQQNEITSVKEKTINENIESSEISVKDDIACRSSIRQCTFIVEKELELAQFMLTQSNCATPSKTRNIQNSSHNTSKANNCIIEQQSDCEEKFTFVKEHDKEVILNEDAVPSTQDLLETAASMLNSEPPENKNKSIENATFIQQNLPQVRKSIRFETVSRKSPTPKKFEFVEMNIEEAHNELHPEELQILVESSSNPINLAQNVSQKQKQKQKSVDPLTKIILECSSHPLNLAPSSSHKDKENYLKNMKGIPLNKAPSTPINGEKFADELKQHLARMSNYQIIDLRKRKSVGKFFRTASKQVRRQLEEQLELELIKRQLNENEIDDKYLDMVPLSPPQEFACIEDLAKCIDAATSVSITHVELVLEPHIENILSPTERTSTVEENIPTRRTECNEEASIVVSNDIAPPTVRSTATPNSHDIGNKPVTEIVPSPPRNDLRFMSPVAIVPPPPMFTSPIISAKVNRNLFPITPSQIVNDVQPRSSILPQIVSQVITQEGEQLTGEDCNLLVNLQPPIKVNNTKKNLVEEYFNVSKKVQKKRIGATENAAKRSLYTENSPKPLTPRSEKCNSLEEKETEDLPPSDDVKVNSLKRMATKTSSSKPSKSKERKSQPSSESDVFKEPFAPAPKKRKTKQTTSIQEEENTENCDGIVLRRSKRPHIQTVDLRTEYLQSFYAKSKEKAIERYSLYKKRERLSRANSRVSTSTSTVRETSNRGTPFSLLGDTNATNSTMNSGISIRTMANICSGSRPLSPILEPIEEQKETESKGKEKAQSKANNKQPKKQSTKKTKTKEIRIINQEENNNEKQDDRDKKKDKKTKKTQENENTKANKQSVRKSGVEHSRLNFSSLPVDELNFLFEHHQQTDQNGSKLEEVENVISKNDKNNERQDNKSVTVHRQLRVQLKRIDMNEQSVDTSSKVTKENNNPKKARKKYKKKDKQQEQKTEAEIPSRTTEPVNIPTQSAQEIQKEGFNTAGASTQVVS